MKQKDVIWQAAPQPTWLKSMVRLPSKQVNFPSLGVYFSILSGLAPRMSVDAEAEHAPQINSSNGIAGHPPRCILMCAGDNTSLHHSF